MAPRRPLEPASEPAWDSLLRRRLHDARTWREREHAIRQVASDELVRERELLVEVAGSNDADAVRCAAIEKLEEGRSQPSVLASLLLKEGRAVIRLELAESLGRLCARPGVTFDRDAVPTSLRQALASERSEEVRRAVAYALQRIEAQQDQPATAP